MYKVIMDIQRTESKYYKIAEALPDALLLVDSAGIIRLFNRQAELMFGYMREQVLDRELNVLLPERFRERHNAHIQKYFEHPTIREMGQPSLALIGLRKDGGEMKIQVMLAPLVDDDGIFAVAVIRRVRESASL